MRKVLLAAAFVFTLPLNSGAAPCVPGTLSDYISLGSTGCEIGSATLSDFTTVAILSGTEILPGAISVTPVPNRVALDFGFGQAAAAGEVFGAAFRFLVNGPAFVANRLDLLGGSATGDGVALGLGITCIDGTFATPDPAGCSGTEANLIVLRDALGAISPDVEPFPPASVLDVFAEVTIDGGLSGSAALDGIRTTFAVPEPTAVLLLGVGSLALAARRRRRQLRRGHHS